MKALLLLLALAGSVLASAMPASADPPTARHVQDVFVDLNPCTGLDHVVTIDITIYDHGASAHGFATITTSSGFVGRGVETSVFDSDIFVLNHMLVNPATGQRIRPHLHVHDGNSTDPRIESSLVCLGA